MFAIAFLFVRMVCDCFKSRRRIKAEILVLRHQLNVLQQRAPRRLYLSWADRALFVWLYRGFPRIIDAITILRPETIVRWHRKGFAAFWRWKSRPLGGRPQIDKEVRDLIRRMSFKKPRSQVLEIVAKRIEDLDHLRPRIDHPLVASPFADNAITAFAGLD
jgi:hypothetical protein